MHHDRSDTATDLRRCGHSLAVRRRQPESVRGRRPIIYGSSKRQTDRRTTATAGNLGIFFAWMVRRSLTGTLDIVGLPVKSTLPAETAEPSRKITRR